MTNVAPDTPLRKKISSTLYRLGAAQLILVLMDVP